MDDTLELLSEDANTLNDKTKTMTEACLGWFNTHPERRTILLRILTRSERFSLRIVDWLATNYSKHHRITIVHKGMPLDVHDDYQRHLAVYNKKLFDPFARRQRIQLHTGEGVVSTTVGQLNFMKWFLERNLDRIVMGSRQEIETDMKNGAHGQDVPAVKMPMYHQGPFILDF